MILSPPQPYQGQLWANRTVGLLGGSFNPAHDGHRHISLYALKHLGLDAVWWMVSPQNPLKSAKDMWPADERLESAERVSNHPKIVATDIERHLNTRYTADTLEELKKHFPNTRFIWLMGTDNLRQIHRWERWEDIFNTVPICVLARPPVHGGMRACKAMERFRGAMIGQNAAKTLKNRDLPAWTMLHIPLNNMSATEIRASLRKKKKKAIIK